MSQWKIEISEEVQVAMQRAISRRPDLEKLVNQRIQALLDFPPSRWFRIASRPSQAGFYPEPGQKVRLTGWVDFQRHLIQITRFSFHE